MDDRIWWDRRSDVLQDFGRDVTVLVYTVEGLKRIITWYVLRLASEGVLVYDRGDMRGLGITFFALRESAGQKSAYVCACRVYPVRCSAFLLHWGREE